MEHCSPSPTPNVNVAICFILDGMGAKQYCGQMKNLHNNEPNGFSVVYNGAWKVSRQRIVWWEVVREEIVEIEKAHNLPRLSAHNQYRSSIFLRTYPQPRSRHIIWVL